MRLILEKAREEMKRADHLLYVSLKYTRTVDVLRSVMDRLVNALDALVDHLLEYALEKKKIEQIPDNRGLRIEMVKKLFREPLVAEITDFDVRLKQILRAEYTRAREYRRHVTMTSMTEFGVVEVNIDVVKEYYLKTKEYLEQTERMIFGEQE